jgi:adenosine deaminase
MEVIEINNISDDMKKYIEGLPKAELHVHFEGTVGSQAIKLAESNNIDYQFKTVKEVENALNNRKVGLESFLDLHYKFVSVITTREDFHEITYEFLRNCRENNVVYVEIKFDPQPHIDRGITRALRCRG